MKYCKSFDIIFLSITIMKTLAQLQIMPLAQSAIEDIAAILETILRSWNTILADSTRGSRSPGRKWGHYCYSHVGAHLSDFTCRRNSPGSLFCDADRILYWIFLQDPHTALDSTSCKVASSVLVGCHFCTTAEVYGTEECNSTQFDWTHIFPRARVQPVIAMSETSPLPPS